MGRKRKLVIDKSIIFFLIIFITIVIVIFLANSIIHKYREKFTDVVNNNNNDDIKNLVFTSAGDKTKFDELWCDKNRNYDIWVIYYGNNEQVYNKYKSKVDFIEKRKGSKFQNFHYVYNKYREHLEKYDRFFILDDDIIFNTQDINKMFEISKKYDLWICGPTFKQVPECKISHPITMQQKGNLLRYTNFVEVNVPLFNKYALNQFMKYYDPVLIGWGIDYLFIWALGKENKNKFALVDEVVCINPQDDAKNNKRELTNVNKWDSRIEIWNNFKKKYNIKEWETKEWSNIKLDNIKNSIYPSKNYSFAIHTVFILEENLPFIREWIIYHKLLGFNKFYLYDNTGSVGRNGSDKNKNKYNIEFKKLLKLDKYKIQNELNDLLSDFKDEITYIKWQPKDKSNQIIYGYNDSVIDYINKYGKENNYTAFIDLDEFICLNDKYQNINDFIIDKTKYNKEYVCFTLNQIKYNDRFCNNNYQINEIDDVLDINVDNNAPKNIIKNDCIDIKNINNMHNIGIKNGKKVKCKTNEIHFKHYNVNNKQVKWLKKYYKIDNIKSKKDKIGLRNRDKLITICGDKCNWLRFVNKDFLNEHKNNICHKF